jgi:hypothetical protein
MSLLKIAENSDHNTDPRMGVFTRKKRVAWHDERDAETRYLA